jgi:hypothetical protein
MARIKLTDLPVQESLMAKSLGAVRGGSFSFGNVLITGHPNAALNAYPTTGTSGSPYAAVDAFNVPLGSHPNTAVGNGGGNPAASLNFFQT